VARTLGDVRTETRIELGDVIVTEKSVRADGVFEKGVSGGEGAAVNGASCGACGSLGPLIEMLIAMGHETGNNSWMIALILRYFTDIPRTNTKLSQQEQFHAAPD
jgi:hypothetical protein